MLNKKAFTLMEVMIAAALVGLVVVTAVSINLAASWLFRSSTSQTSSQNEAALVMEMILRDIRGGYGEQIFGAGQGIIIYIAEPNLTGSDPWNGIENVKYMWDGNHTLTFYPRSNSNLWASPSSVISTKITNLNFQEVTQANPNRINIQVQITATDQNESTSLDSTATLLYRPTQYPWE